MAKETKIDEKSEHDMVDINNILSSLDENFQFIGVTFGRSIGRTYTFRSDNKVRKYYTIGNDFGNKIAIEIETLEVFRLASKYYRKFINSSLKIFLECMKAVNRKVSLMKSDLNDDENKKLEQEIIKEIKNIDPKALVNDETWWTEKFKMGIIVNSINMKNIPEK
ncbi:hypothetical protein FACS189447_11010 [Spirochaetia bacterium]|nr:hypothetical protein FACS189447_11010 [Spirochaetia bacterium]GHV96684.1 hypothetical protein AGMMS50293_30040 [Spirochaetia bacterium]